MDVSINATASTAATDSSSTAAYYKTAADGESCPDKSDADIQDSPSPEAKATVAASAAANGSRLDWNNTGDATSEYYSEEFCVQPGSPTQEIRGGSPASNAAENTSSGHGHYEDTTPNNASPKSETSVFSSLCTSEGSYFLSSGLVA